MPRLLRTALALVGLSAALYATASLTGGWLGTPPWWERAAPMDDVAWLKRYRPDSPAAHGFMLFSGESRLPEEWEIAAFEAPRHREPREGREILSGTIAAVGYALFAVAAWPRKERLEQDEEPAS